MCVVVTSWLAGDQQVHSLVETAQISVRSLKLEAHPEGKGATAKIKCSRLDNMSPLCTLGEADAVVGFCHGPGVTVQAQAGWYIGLLSERWADMGL